MTHPDILAERQATARRFATEVVLEMADGSEVAARLADYQTNGPGGPGTHVDTDLITGLAEVVARQQKRLDALEAKLETVGAKKKK